MVAHDDVDQRRARWIRLLLDDPARARRERLRAAREYWRHRVELLEERLRAAEDLLNEALQPPPEDDLEQPPIPPVEVWRLRCACVVAWADVQEARARLEGIDRELERR